MPYNTTGEVHHAGTRNEVSLVSIFSASPPTCFSDRYGGSLTFVHLGGTKRVSDIEIDSDGARVDDCSVKLHREGTFDYINTSKLSDYIQVPKLVELVGKKKRDHLGDKNAINLVRNLLADAINSEMDAITSDAIRKLLLNIYARSPRWLIVTEKGKLSIIDHSNLHELSLHPTSDDTTYFLKSSGRAKTSRQIWRMTGGIETNTTLRLRLTLNNGVGALLGLSNKNSSSLLTLKVQQDSVDSLLKKVHRSVVALS